MNWIACTPLSFPGTQDGFFSRDSGLCCRTLQALGAGARVVMPEPAHPGDMADVLRVPRERLNDPGFWRAQHADAVILYSWADPRYTPVARAIKLSGARLFVNLDSYGWFSPIGAPGEYISAMFAAEFGKHGKAFGALRAGARLTFQILARRRHAARLRHMAWADAVGVVSPAAAQRVSEYVRGFHRPDVAAKVHFVPHPVDEIMRYDGRVKQPAVLAVGRWDDVAQKRPELLVEVAATVLARDPAARFTIVGVDANRCVERIRAQCPRSAGRVAGAEHMSHPELQQALSAAAISLCTSRYESFHIASGEALLCGCTVVGPRSPLLPSLDYFSDGGNSGRLSENTAPSLAATVLAELDAWRRGLRAPAAIAGVWRERIAASAVVGRIERLLFDPPAGGPGTT